MQRFKEKREREGEKKICPPQMYKNIFKLFVDVYMVLRLSE